MNRAALPDREEERLKALYEYEILDTPPEPAFDSLTGLAVQLLEVPMAAVSLLDRDRQWFKSLYGPQIPQTSRETSFCAHAILQNGPFLVEDARLDERFADNPAVVGGPRIVFFAAIPVRSSNGLNLGALCVMDTEPRRLSPEQLLVLNGLAAMVTQELQLRLCIKRLKGDQFSLYQAQQTPRRGVECTSFSSGHVQRSGGESAERSALQNMLETTPPVTELLSRQLAQVSSVCEAGVLKLMGGIKGVDEQIAQLSVVLHETKDRSVVMHTSADSIVAESAKHLEGFREYSQRRIEKLNEDDNAVRKIMEQVEGLVPLAGGIRNLVSQSHILALNASIEASRAGEAGLGFAVVAQEVRTLSKEVDGIASRITEEIRGITDMAGTGFNFAQRLDERIWLETIQAETERLADVLKSAVSELKTVSSTAADATSQVRLSLLESLGHVQFQDITRQQLGVVQDALQMCGSRFAQAAALLRESPRGLVDLRMPDAGLLLEELRQKYTMATQHRIHQDVLGAGADSTEDGPSIELF
jgi:methyl-accepting chemotaxis protein